MRHCYMNINFQTCMQHSVLQLLNTRLHLLFVTNDHHPLFSVSDPGLMGVTKSPSLHSSISDPGMPGICKELVGQSLARLRSSTGSEESMADRLISDLNLVYMAVQTISDLYDSLDDDSQDSGEFQSTS